MMSRSYTNLLDLAAGNFPRKSLPRVMTVPGVVSELDDDDRSSDHPSSIPSDRIIIVANLLPIKADRSTGSWTFSYDEESVLFQLKDGFPEDTDVVFVGALTAEIDPRDHDEVSQTLLDRFRCVPAFLPDHISVKFYDGFCKKHLWSLFHYMLPVIGKFDRSLWEAYVAANKIFSQKVIEVINPEDDYVWVHDYHLMVVPSFLRRRFNRLRIGFFLHSPFPSSEIYRSLPVREEILKALLNSDLIGFHTFDYARHFLSCCSRMLGLEYESKRGYIGLEYFGRTVGIKILPVGIHMKLLESALMAAEKENRVKNLCRLFEGKTVLLGMDDLDTFKGIDLKLQAFELMLKLRPGWIGKAVLIQIVNKSGGRGKDGEEIGGLIKKKCDQINDQFSSEGYQPLIYIDSELSYSERIAYYAVAEAVVVTAVRDGMNLAPYEYVVCRQGERKSVLVVSEFVGCSPSLSGAVRINPWNIESTAEAMHEAISMDDAEKELRHEKHYRYVSTHDVGYWSKSFLQDLERCCKDHFRRRCWGMGLGFGFRVIAMDPSFRKLHFDAIASAYSRTKNRAILLDYDGTLMPQSSLNKAPAEEVLEIIRSLITDPRNVIFIVSGRRRDNLDSWFPGCKKMGIAAEHGYFMRWGGEEDWEKCNQGEEFGWVQIVEPVMKQYTEATDGSSIEVKESALVWHYQDAEPGFGSSQAKELLDHLESVLANEPVAVKSGQFIVEVKPQGVGKGMVARKILTRMKEKGRQAGFVLCIGDDRSDEDMFEGISAMTKDLVSPGAPVFACTVGQKPSKARYYLDDTADVITTLRALADASDLYSASEDDEDDDDDVSI